MLRTPDILAAVIAGLCLSAPAYSGKGGAGPARLESVIEGTYEIRRAGQTVGAEQFTESVYDNNTVVLESTYEVSVADGSVVSGDNRLVLEEDSLFPKKYDSGRSTTRGREKRYQETAAQMFANVVVWTTRLDTVEQKKTVVLPTGSLFIESNIAHQLGILLSRYNRSLGGKQSFDAFELLAGRKTRLVLEYLGEADAGQATGIAAGALESYKFVPGNSPPVYLEADSRQRITRIRMDSQGLEYVLTRLHEADAVDHPESE